MLAGEPDPRRPRRRGGSRRRSALEPSPRQRHRRRAPRGARRGCLGATGAARAQQPVAGAQRRSRRHAPARSSRRSRNPRASERAGEKGPPAGKEHMRAEQLQVASETKPGRAKPRAKRPTPRPRGSVVAAVDIGTGKICCFIARATEKGPQIIGIGHQVSRGVRNGIIVDLDAASASIADRDPRRRADVRRDHHRDRRQPVGQLPALAHRQCRDRRRRATRSATATCGASSTRAITSRIRASARSSTRSRSASRSTAAAASAIRAACSARSSASTCTSSRRSRRRSATSPRRSAAAISTSAASSSAPTPSGLASLVEDETDLGVTIIDMGAGTTTIGVFFDGNLIFADSVPIGGGHVTNDIARGLSTPLVHAERMKTLYGSAIASSRGRARDDHRAAGRRGGRGPGDARAEIAARRHHLAATRRDLRARPATGSRRAATTRSPVAASC